MNRIYILSLINLALFSNSTLSIGEAVPFALLGKILPDNPIILEAGAQFGEDTRWMSEFWPTGKIFSFEPNPESFNQLIQNTSTLSNVSTYKIGLDKSASTKDFYLAGGASSILKPTKCFNDDYFHADLNNPIKIECTTLDTWCQEHGIKKIDFMWLDLEGNELNALMGGEQILKTVTAIYTEVNLQRFWEECVMYSELKSWLEEKGFTEVWKDIAPDWHGNVLFIKK